MVMGRLKHKSPISVLVDMYFVSLYEVEKIDMYDLDFFYKKKRNALIIATNELTSIFKIQTSYKPSMTVAIL